MPMMSDDFKIILPLLSALLGSLIGAAAAIGGSFITQYLQARYTARKKLDEIVAEKQVMACTEAYISMKMVQSILGNSGSNQEQVLKDALCYFLGTHEEWFLRSRLFLPGNFPDLWFAVRNELLQAINMERKSAGSASVSQQQLWNLVGKSIEEIYHHLHLRSIRPEIYQQRKLGLRNRWLRWKEQ
jgi:hypothetical protein